MLEARRWGLEWGRQRVSPIIIGTTPTPVSRAIDLGYFAAGLPQQSQAYLSEQL
jgi:hypothetical protein